MASSRTNRVQEVIKGLERAHRRKAKPFELTIEVLAINGDMATLVGPNYALAPIALYASIHDWDWLRETLEILV